MTLRTLVIAVTLFCYLSDFVSTVRPRDVIEDTFGMMAGRSAGDTLDYEHMWLTLDHSDIWIRIKTCENARIVLSPRPFYTTENTYEIVIDNKGCEIRREVGGEAVASNDTDTSDFLVCDGFRNFWFSWGGGVVRAGRGLVVGIQQFMVYPDPTPYTVNAVSMATFDAQQGDFEWLRGVAWTVHLRSRGFEDSNGLWISEYDRDYVKFGVKTCRQAKIGLTGEGFRQNNWGQKCYLIIMGTADNPLYMETWLRVNKGGKEVARADTPDIVSCDQMRYFWISWKDNFIEMGRGTVVGSGRFLHWLDEDKLYNITSVNMYGGTQQFIPGDWRFDQIEESTFVLQSQGGYSDTVSHWVNVEGRHLFQFQVRLCMNGVIRLKQKQDMSTGYDVKLVMNNTDISVTILDQEGLNPITKAYKHGSLACSAFMPYWLAWDTAGTNAMYTFGTGYVPWENAIFNIFDPYGTRAIRAIDLGSLGADDKVAWQFTRDTGKVTTVNTHPIFDKYPAWFTVREKQSLVFGLKACQTSTLSLATYLGLPYSPAYTIHLGSAGNNHSTILKDGVLKRSVHTPRLLACATTQYLWVEWSGGVISVGNGLTPGLATFLTLDDSQNNPHDVNAVGFDSDSGAIWIFGEVDGNYYSVSTPTGEYEHIWFTTNSFVFPFSVRAYSHVKVLLSMEPGQIQNGSAYEVSIGSSMNTYTELRVVGTGESEGKVTPLIVRSNAYTKLWLSWYGGTLRLGVGDPLGDELLSLKPNKSIPVRAISLAAEDIIGADWIFHKDQAEHTRIRTGAEKSYDQFWMTNKFDGGFTFKVRASMGAHVLLAGTVGNTEDNSFEVIFGAVENTQTLIRNGSDGTVLEQTETVGILNSVEFVDLWISWLGGHIQIGRGNIIGLDRVLEWQGDTDIPIHGIAFSTGFGAEGDWEFIHLEDYMFHVKTNPDEGMGGTWIQTPEQYFEFSVTACWDARVGMFSEVTQEGLYAYEVVLGAENNTHIQLWDSRSVSTPVASAVHDSVVSCFESRQFWVKVEQGVVQVGRGTYPSFILLEWVDNDPHTITAFSISSSSDHNTGFGLWKFRENIANKLTTVTNGQPNFNKLWLTTRRQTYMTFKVRACGQVQLALSTYPGVTGMNTYLIGIGVGADNTAVNIIHDGLLQAERNLNEVVMCDMFMQFWVSWHNGVIQVGRGTYQGDTRIIGWKHDDPHPVNVVAMTTDEENDGLWEFFRLQGNVHIIQTYQFQSGAYADTWLFPRSYLQHLSFRASVCETQSLKIILNQNPSTTVLNSYEIEIGTKNSQGQVVSLIRRNAAGQILDETITPAVVSCISSQDYWIAWGDQSIRFGKGYYPENLLLQTPNTNIDINAVLLGSSSTATWSFEQENVEVVRIHIHDPNVLAYKRMWLTEALRTNAIFNVKACKHVGLALSALPGDVIFETYLIEIQTSDGMTQIKDTESGEVVEDISQPMLLDCDQFRTFWVDWTGGHVQLGQGAAVGQATLIDHQFDNPHFVNGLGIHSYYMNGNLGSSDWYFLRQSGKIYRLHTYDEYDRSYRGHFVYVEQARFTFRVRTCKDAGLVLVTDSPDGFGRHTYEIILGGWENSESAIKHLLTWATLARVQTPGLLDCDSFRTFWISWENGVLEVGEGDLFDFSFMSLPLEDEADMHAVTFGTLASYGEWEIRQYDDETYWTSTEGGYHYNTTWISVLGESSIKLYIQACESAHLALGAVPGNAATMAYEIVIGSEGNAKTEIRQEIDGADLASEPTDKPLSCSNFREFWVSWTSHSIAVGKGGVPQEAILAQFTSESSGLRPIHAIGLATGEGVKGQFVHGNINDTAIPPDTVVDETIVLHTVGTGEEEFQNNHWTVTNDRLVFLLRGCQDAMLSLQNYPGSSDYNAYAIYIGEEGNTRTRIVKKLQENMFNESYPSLDIINCFEDRAFWVHWGNGYIEFGEGEEPGVTPVATLYDPDLLQINALSVASDKDSTKWQFAKASAHDYVLGTSQYYDYRQTWWTVYNTDSVVFFVQACADPHILLSDRIQNEENVYEVALGILDNTASVIRNEKYGTNIVSVESYNIVSCDELRPFWISWHQGVKVGTGVIVGTNTFMQYNDPVGKPIRAVGISTGWQSSGIWKISNVPLDTFSIFTYGNVMDPGHNIWIYENTQHFEFTVKSCSNVSLLLSQEPLTLAINQTEAYMIKLGTNINKDIQLIKYPEGNMVASQAVDKPLNCHSHRPFWVSWYEGIIQIGTGAVFTRSLFSHDVTDDVLVRTVALAQGGDDAQWEFSRYAGSSTVFTMTADDSKHILHWLDVTGRNSVVFKATSCNAIQIMLSKDTGIINTFRSYEVMIRTVNTNNIPANTIKSSMNGNTEAQNTEVFLDCKFARWFWVSWTSQITDIYVGHGFEPGDQLIMHWADIPNGHPIESIGFRGIEQESVWEFSDIPANLIAVRTAPASEEIFQNVYMSIHRNYFLFSLKSCAEAKLALTAIPGVTGLAHYQVIIGGWANTRSVIWDSETESTLAEADTLYYVDCAEYRDFWMSWFVRDSGVVDIVVGRGHSFSQVFLNATTSTPHPIHVVSLSTGTSNFGFWRFTDDSAMSTHVKTPDAYSYENYVYKVIGRNGVTFKVQACGEAHIALFDHLHAVRAYEIIIGRNSNADTVIRKKLLGDEEALAETPGVLSCDKFTQFYIAWFGGRIVVGFGEIRGVAEIVSFEDPEPTSVSYMAISTGWGNEGNWIFYNIPDETFLVATPDTQTNMRQQLWVSFTSSQNFYLLSVRACADARVLLRSGGSGSRILFELRIGAEDNRKVQLLSGDGVLIAEKAVTDVMNCLEQRKFYLTWEDTTINLIQGSQNGRRLLSHTLSPPAVGFGVLGGLSLQTGPGYKGEWILPRYAAKSLQYSNNATARATYNHLWLTVSGVTSVVLNVRSCRHATIILSQTPGVTTGNAYEILLGAEFNHHSEIRLGASGEVKDQVDTRDLLDCNAFKTFWVSWYGGMVTVGQSTLVGRGKFLQWENPDPFDVTGLAVSSVDQLGENSQTIWDFSVFGGNSYYVATPDELDYKRAIFSPKDNFFKFSLRACSDGHLALSTVPGDTTHSTYIVVIAGWGNTKSIIRETTHFVEYEKEGLLDCEYDRDFWISWNNTGIDVGAGKDIGTNMFMSWSDTNPIHEINAVSLSTGFGVSGIWQVPIDQERMAQITLPANDFLIPDVQWVTVSGFSTFVFRVRACADVKIILAAVQGNTELMASEVALGVNNQMSYISENSDGVISASVDTPGILSCEQFRAFHISWNLYSIVVGFGANPTEGIILRHTTNESLHFVTTLGFLSTPSKNIEYEIVKFFGNTIGLVTDNVLNYERLSLKTSRTEFIFRIKSCADGHIKLAADINSDVSDFYEIVIGGYKNDKSDIRRRPGGLKKQVSTPFILNCDEYRYFWITWDRGDGTLRVGSGLVPGTGEFLFWQEDDVIIPIDTISISSWDNNGGEWEIDQRTDDIVYITTPDDYDYSKAALTIMDKTEFAFKVKACRSAHVALSSIPGILNALTYEVIFGALDNTVTEIKEGVGGMLLNFTTKQGVVDCENFKELWISWAGGKLAVGEGRVAGENQLTSTPIDIPITYISLSSYIAVPGTWEYAIDHTRPYPPVTEPPPTTGMSSMPTTPKTTGVTGTSTTSRTTGTSTTSRTTGTSTTAQTTGTTAATQTASTVKATTVTLPSSTVLQPSTTPTKPPSPSTPSAPVSSTIEDPLQEVDGGGLSTGQAVGVAFGVIFGVVLIAIIGFFIYRERYRCTRASEEATPIVFDMNEKMSSESYS